MKKLITTIYTLAVTLSTQSVLFAQVSPYEPHTPIDTGFEFSAVYTFAFILFILGTIILLNTSLIKSKLNLV